MDENSPKNTDPTPPETERKIEELEAKLDALQKTMDTELAALREAMKVQSNMLDHVVKATNRSIHMIARFEEALMRHEQLLFPENDPKLQPLTHKLMKRDDEPV